MSVTVEEAYSSVRHIFEDCVVDKCLENGEEWLFFFRRITSKPAVPGDYRSPIIVNKNSGAITFLIERLGDGIRGLLRFNPQENGYTSVDNFTQTRSFAQEEERPLPLPKAAVA